MLGFGRFFHQVAMTVSHDAERCTAIRTGMVQERRSVVDVAPYPIQGPPCLGIVPIHLSNHSTSKE